MAMVLMQESDGSETAACAAVATRDPATPALQRRILPPVRTHGGLLLIDVAHGDRVHDVVAEDRRLFASVDTVFIGEDVYPFCASEGPGTVFRGALGRKKPAEASKLDDKQLAPFVPTVGRRKARTNPGSCVGRIP